MKNKLRALIWDASSERRSVLKQLLKNTDRYGDITSVHHASQVKAQFEEARWDVLLIPSSVEGDNLKQIVAEIKSTERGQLAVLIASIAVGDQNPAVIAARHAFGLHACIMEPYSVDDVVQVTNQAFSLREQLKEERNLRAVEAIISEAQKHIDVISTKMKVQLDPGDSRRCLNETGKIIGSLDSDLQELYIEQMIETLINAEVPEFIPGAENYTGSSRAMQKRAEERRQAIREGRVRSFEQKERAEWVEARERDDGTVTPPARG